MRKYFFLTLLAIAPSCTTTAEPINKEPTKSMEQEIIAPGMLSPGYTPIAPGSGKVIARFDPMASLENVTQLNGTYYATSILGSQIYVKDKSTPPDDYFTIPIDTTPGTFMAGIDRLEDQVIFATASFTPTGEAAFSSVYSLDPISLEYTLITQIPEAALNGLGILDTPEGKIWISIDALAADEEGNGIIWGGSIQNGDFFIWYAGQAVESDPDYIPTPCNPPMAVKGNGLRVQNRFGQRYVVVSNTTGSSIWSIDVTSNGNSGNAWKWYDQQYPDDIWPDGCGLPFPMFPHGTWVAGHGLHKTYWINPYTGERVLIADGTVCNGNTAIINDGNEMILTCAADVLICGPDENGDPDPNVFNPSTPTLYAFDLDPGYVRWCRP